MFSDEDEYTIEGLYRPILDAPCVCTPLFRNSDGKRYFVQSFERKNRIDEFFFIGYESDDAVVDHISNTRVKVGDRVHMGIIMPDGRTYVRTNLEIRSFLRDNFSLITPYPIFFYQLSLMARDKGAIRDALEMSSIRQSIERREARFYFPFDRKAAHVWDQDRVDALVYMFSVGYSAAEIGRIVGFSRNAVLSKAKRIGLKNKEVMDGIKIVTSFDKLQI